MNDREDNELDRLLEEIPAPEAPPWFKQKTLNRLRESQSSGFRLADWWARFQGVRLASLAATVAVLVAVAALFFAGESAPDAPLAKSSLDSALDAFVSYTEENSEWGGDPFL